MIINNSIVLNSQDAYINGKKVSKIWIQGLNVYSVSVSIGETVEYSIDFTDYDLLVINDGVFRHGYMEAMKRGVISFNIDFTDYDILQINDGVFRIGYMEAMQ